MSGPTDAEDGRSETKKKKNRTTGAAGMLLGCQRGEDGWQQGDRDTERGQEAAGEMRLAASSAYLLVQIF